MFDFRDLLDKANQLFFSAMVVIGLPPHVSSAISGVTLEGFQQEKTDWQSLPLTSGHYIFYADAPSGFTEKVLPEVLETQVQGKKVTINWVLYHLKTKKVEIGVRLYDNPIPIIMVWGAITTVLIGLTALAVRLVITDVKKIIVTPAGIGLVAIGLLFGAGYFIKAGGFKGLKGG